jgi:hypothetical protein
MSETTEPRHLREDGVEPDSVLTWALKRRADAVADSSAHARAASEDEDGAS